MNELEPSPLQKNGKEGGAATIFPCSNLSAGKRGSVFYLCVHFL